MSQVALRLLTGHNHESVAPAVVVGSSAADLGSTLLVSGIGWLLTGLERLQLERLSSSPH